MNGWRAAVRAWIPSLVWAAVIFVLSSFPGSAYPDPGLVNADKLVHVGVYGLLGVLCARGFLAGSRLALGPVLAAASGLSTLYGVTDELHQFFVPGRNSDWRDVVADGVGSLVGAAVIVVVARRRR